MDELECVDNGVDGATDGGEFDNKESDELNRVDNGGILLKFCGSIFKEFCTSDVISEVGRINRQSFINRIKTFIKFLQFVC